MLVHRTSYLVLRLLSNYGGWWRTKYDQRPSHADMATSSPLLDFKDLQGPTVHRIYYSHPSVRRCQCCKRVKHKRQIVTKSRSDQEVSQTIGLSRKWRGSRRPSRVLLHHHHTSTLFLNSFVYVATCGKSTILSLYVSLSLSFSPSFPPSLPLSLTPSLSTPHFTSKHLSDTSVCSYVKSRCIVS